MRMRMRMARMAVAAKDRNPTQGEGGREEWKKKRKSWKKVRRRKKSFFFFLVWERRRNLQIVLGLRRELF